MAFNTGYPAELNVSLGQDQFSQEPNVIEESPIFDGVTHVHSHHKRPRTNSPPVRVKTPAPIYRSDRDGLAMGQETKKLIVTNCRAIVRLESNLTKLEAKSTTLEQHRLNGTVPKDLLLPKKKSLFEDEQSKVDDILQTASNALLAQRISETSRKKSELLLRKTVIEKNVLKTLEASRDSQLKFLSPENQEEIAIINQRHDLNIHSFYSQLAIQRENAFIKTTREAEKEAKKKQREDSAMDTSPETRVIDVLDQRLKQLGLIGRKSKSRSSSPKSSSPASRKSRSRSSFSSNSGSSRNSSFSSRSPSHSSLKRKNTSRKNTSRKKKTVKFEPQQRSKNGGTTTPPYQRRKGKGRGNGRR